MGSAALWQIGTIVGFVALGLWAAWWGYALYASVLVGAEHTLLRLPMFGADFSTETDYAARSFAAGVDPYAARGHLFHYPPLVIRLFLWTPSLPLAVALRIWLLFNIAVIVVATTLAIKVRRRLPVGQLPASLALALVLFSSPVIFELERANFNLITLAAILIALPLFARRDRGSEVLAGAVLAVGPWVKIYPGLMGFGLVALRRWKAVAGFVVAGVLIGLMAPAETMRSFEVLALAIERYKSVSLIDAYHPWSHSISVAYLKIAQAALPSPISNALIAVPIDTLGLAIVLGGASCVSYPIFRLRSKSSQVLVFPLLLWLNAIGSCVGVIANDYSLTFLPLAAIIVHSFKDPWFVKLAMLTLVIWWQPFDPHLPGLLFLLIKLIGIASVGVSLVLRAKELASRVVDSEPEPAPLASATASTDC